MDKAGFSGGCKAVLEEVIGMRVADFIAIWPSKRTRRKSSTSRRAGDALLK